MSQNTIISLAIIGAVLIIAVVAINQVAEVFKDNKEAAWFILGFGSCLFLEGALWWFVRLYKRIFP